ncbi:PREDICTED: tuberin-like [Acropora digitifera]|uniref:tuberin-like n=1 Tax=Acropora digitifera TaxID=70779 RepID=UPI00077A5AC0|nr:PREDICTED: tuberin-like [Acropora digitifera]
MSKQNVSEGFRQKVKQFFGVKKGNVITSSVYEGPKPDEFYFHQELLQEISKESPLSNRVKVLRELCDFLASRRVEDHAIEAAWEAVNDLLEASNPVEARHVTLQFLTVMVFAQLGRLGILRAHFFSVVAGHKVAEDVSPRLELLKALSDNGKDISYFEEVTGPFLLSWMPEVMKGGRMDVFMPLVINVIHYNSSFLDEDIITGIVRETCNVTRTTKEEEDIELCLCLLDAVVRYSCLPSNALFDFIAIACRAVNIEKFCQHSWKLLSGGKHCFYYAYLSYKCSDNHSDTMLLRGSVFFIGMCLWGSQRVPNLKYSNTTVLPSMLQALSSHHSLVALEVTLSVQRLVKKYGHELNVVAWDSVLDISEALQKQIEVYSPGENSLIENLHILFTSIEELFETNKFNGPEERFFALIEKSASKRPEHSLHVLVSFKAQTVHPAQEGWLTNLHNLMEKYFRYEIRTSVRAKVLSVLSSVLTSYGHWYEDELLDVAVLPYLSHISEDQDVTVRNEAAQIIIDLCLTSDSLKCQDFLSIIEKVISRHVELLGKGQQLDEKEQLLQEEKELKDVKTAISGLVQVFKAKLFRLPHSHAVRALQLLVSHVKAHYDHRYSTYIASIIRIMTFECFLSLRCDSSLRIGACNSSEEENNTKFSRYFTCWHSDLDAKPSSHLGIIQYSEVFEVILKCVQDEWDWTVLEHVLKALPEVLQNKSLILSANPALNAMTSVLCHMVLEPSYIHDLHRVPSGVGRVGLLALIFQVLTVLATYHSNLDRRRQVELVRALELGLGTKCAVRCVSSLTLCTMEMQAVMKSLLPALLFRLSQISATVAMAAPMLEFLSGLVHLPHLYTSFQDSQYKSVFAICLPYTDPYRYSQYTLTLAYHVIAAWFVRSRLAYRKAFVGFVSKGLKASAVNPERFDPRPDSPALATAKSHSNNVSNQPSPQTAPRSISPVTKKETDSSCELHSEMSELASDEENVLSRKVEDHRERTGMQFLVRDTDLQMTRDSADANGKAALTLSLDSGSRVAQLRELETESQAPKKSKLKKSSSTNSPIRNMSVLSQSLHSPFASPLQSRRSMAKKSKEAEDRLGLTSASGQPKKSSSSPELSSPPAFPRALGKTSSSRIVSHGGRPQSISKSDKSAPLPGDVADTGPKEPPILVTPSESFRYSLDPSFVFLQLYHASFLGSSNEKPEPLPDSEVIERAIKCLDRIPPYDTHKIGVIYVGPGQHDNEAAILGNVYGSSRYMTFLSGLGTLVRLRDCPPAEIYTGGLDRNGEDGEFAYSWQDDICQVIFHVATLMPTRESDPGCNSKKLHIGNDFVTIVYNDSQQTVKFGRIKGQFNFAEVVIKPLDNASNMVTLRFKDELKDLLTDSGPRVISDANLPRLVRQLVVHINVSSKSIHYESFLSVIIFVVSAIVRVLF